MIAKNSMNRLTADLILVFAAAIWGLAFVFQKTAMDAIGPFTFIASRSIVAALALAPFAWFETRRNTAPTAPGPALSRIAVTGGVFFFIAAAFQQVGLKTATVTNAGFLTALYVIFTPFVAWAWHKRQPSLVIWPAAALSFAGTWLLGGASFAAFNAGDILVAICAVFWAVHVVITGASSRHGRPFTFTCLQFSAVAALGTIAAIVTETPTRAGLAAAATEIAYVGLLSSALTFTLLAVAMKHTPPAEASIIVSTESLFGALAGALLLGERLPLIAWTGAALIVIATLLVQLAPSWQARRNDAVHRLAPDDA